MWIETNDAEVGLSELAVTATRIVVPQHIHIDCLCNYQDDDICCSYEIEPIDSGNGKFIYAREDESKIRTLRLEAYRACHWYYDIEDTVPTAKSILVRVHSLKDIKQTLEKYIEAYPFVKSCGMSPKDIIDPPVFDSSDIDLNVENAMMALCQSIRTIDIVNMHLFMREKLEFVIESRCWVRLDKLRAVSSGDDITQYYDLIVEFFTKHMEHFPYFTAIVDIGITAEHKVYLIEFNTFGPDMIATAGNFSWYEDIAILLNAPKPVFRHPDMFGLTVTVTY